MVGDGIHVMVVSLPALSHLNSLLHFSGVIAQRGATVSFVTPCAHIQQVHRCAEGWELHIFNIHFEEMPMPNLLPGDINAHRPNLFPLHLIPLFESLEDQLGPHVEQLMHKIWSEKSNSVVLVHDSAMGRLRPLAAATTHVLEKSAYWFHSDPAIKLHGKLQRSLVL